MEEHDWLEMLVPCGRARDVTRMGEGLVSSKSVKFGNLVPATTLQRLR